MAGYSRLPVFLQAFTNKRSSTILLISLTQLISMMCLPELGVIIGAKTDSFRILCSVTLTGGHKEGVALPVEVFTTSKLSVYGGMFIYNGCTCYFYSHFSSCLKAAGVLDPDNELDIVALHHMYLPWIQHQLDIFKDT